MKGRGSQTKTHIKSVVSSIRGIFPVSANRQGYTIVEVMVFLAVTTALFVMIAGTFSRRQAGTEFSIAARDMESRLQDIANDVSTGFYNNPGNFRCRVSGGAPVIDTVEANEQGTNDDCIFIGRVAQFDLNVGDGKQYNIYSVVGARQTSGRDVENFDEARPRAIANPVSPVDLTESQQLSPGLVVRSMYAQYGANRQRIRAVGFFTSFGSGSAATDPSSLSVNIVPLGFGTPNTKDAIVNAVSGISNGYFSLVGNPPDGVVVCMDGDATNQHAILKLGGNERQLATDLTIGEGTCEDAGYPA
jgi:hypothetical protein